MKINNIRFYSWKQPNNESCIFKNKAIINTYKINPREEYKIGQNSLFKKIEREFEREKIYILI